MKPDNVLQMSAILAQENKNINTSGESLFTLPPESPLNWYGTGGVTPKDGCPVWKMLSELIINGGLQGRSVMLALQIFALVKILAIRPKYRCTRGIWFFTLAITLQVGESSPYIIETPPLALPPSLASQMSSSRPNLTAAQIMRLNPQTLPYGLAYVCTDGHEEDLPLLLRTYWPHAVSVYMSAEETL